LRIGHGAKNMAVVRHFALNLVRQVADSVPSNGVASALPWTLDISWRYWGRWRVNLDSLPCEQYTSAMREFENSPK
jgi:hypothetical protein